MKFTAILCAATVAIAQECPPGTPAILADGYNCRHCCPDACDGEEHPGNEACYNSGDAAPPAEEAPADDAAPPAVAAQECPSGTPAILADGYDCRHCCPDACDGEEHPGNEACYTGGDAAPPAEEAPADGDSNVAPVAPAGHGDGAGEASGCDETMTLASGYSCRHCCPDACDGEEDPGNLACMTGAAMGDKSAAPALAVGAAAAAAAFC